MTLENKINEEKAKETLREASRIKEAQDRAELFYTSIGTTLSLGGSIIYGCLSSYEPETAFALSSVYALGGSFVSYTVANLISSSEKVYNWFKD